MKKAALITICVLISSNIALADWDPIDDGTGRIINHKMHYPQMPDITHTGMDVIANWPLPYTDPGQGVTIGKILADDWQCSQSGPVTDIHIWGSWLWDELPMDPSGLNQDPQNVRFKLSIHDDVKAGEDPLVDWSHPASPARWEMIFEPHDPRVVARLYAEIPAGDEPELFYDPNTEQIMGEDRQVWQYNFFLDATDNVFVQEEGNIYWLDVQAWPEPGLAAGSTALFGWKTSRDHFNDDAVFGDNLAFGEEPVALGDLGDVPWKEMRYPFGHEFETESIDLAFVITPEPTTMTLLAIGGLFVLKRRRRK